MTDTTKKWYQSKTIWGILIGAISFFLSTKLGVTDLSLPENPDFNQLKQYYDGVKAAGGNTQAIVLQLISAASWVMAIIGRVQAGQKISK